MNKYFTFLWGIIISTFFCSLSLAQSGDNADKIWSIKIDPEKKKEILPDFNWIPAEQTTKFYDFESAITVGPNIRVKPTTNTTQSELSIDVHPLNKNIVFSSANATPYPVAGIYGTGVYWSLDGSTTWTGFDNPPFGSNSGDPASVIGTDGKFYENYITSTSGQGVSVSTNNGGTWTSYTIAPNPGTLADKNHYMVDKKVGSPYEHRSYCSWTDFGGAFNNQVVLRFSTNFGATWTASMNLSSTLNPLSHAQGTNIQTGPNGEVYVAYAIYDAWPGGEDAIGLSKSTNGGATWTHARIYSAVNFGIRGNLSSKASIRVSSFPSMAVDKTGGPTNGNIYITWPQRGVAPAGSDPDIVLIKSTNGGTTWTSPVRVNNDPLNNGKDQYYPWCTVDQMTGQLMLVFYDSRNVTNNQAEVFMARSLDAGATFENFKVSDQAHTPAPISGLASGYAGDYIGVAGLGDAAYPFWADNRTGIYQAWTAKVTYGIPCPVGAAANPSPAHEATNVSAYLPQISWTNGSAATQCEVRFGISGSMTTVYSGPLITSWPIPAKLNYNTTYNWQVINKNDTCNASSTLWAFTTELSPGIVFTENFNNLSCWTATGPLGTTNWSTQNTINAGGTAPELRMSWTPEFNGLSKLVSCPLNLLNNRTYSVQLKHMVDWYANPAPNIGIGISYNGGTTYTPIWNITPTGNVGPATVTGTFTTPPGDSPEAVTANLVIFCNGNSFNLDYWYVDNISLNDDDFSIVIDPTSVTATPISPSQINVGFSILPSNNAVIVWNLTGVFTSPSGTPPSPGQPFAGGTLLYNGTTSPVSHTGLNASTTYFYKVFSYDNTNYSTGVTVNAATPAAPQTFQLSVSINGGWNMVSIPGLMPTNQSVNTWWPYRDQSAGVFRFQAGYIEVGIVQPGVGYYLKHIGSRVYNTGDEWPAGGILFVPHDPIPAVSGWNMFGGYEQTVQTAGLTTTPSGLISSQIFKYDNGYIAATTIVPGYGYWVKLSGAGSINIPSSSAGPVAITKVNTDNFGKITFTDNDLKSYTLYAADNESDLAMFELPPLPPMGMFDIRYSSHRSAERISGNVQGIDLSAYRNPVKVSAEKVGIILSDEFGREIARIKAGEEVSLSLPSNKLFVTENLIPAVYALEQNYPNPFNPSTMIQFSLPEDVQNVKLTIFNSLGEKIAELVDGSLQAGFYNYRWDAGNAASGIYIYQIVTEKFVTTKKMMMLK